MSGQQPVIIWLNSVLMVLTIAALCARVGRRIFVVGKFGGHDSLITLAAVSACIFSSLQIVGTTYGLGRHQDQVDPSNMPKIAKLLLASNCFYFLCNWVVKHALLLFYTEISREKSHHYAINFMHFIAFGFGSSSILVNIFQCRPFRKAWAPEISGYCVNIDYFLYANASIMLTTDIVLYAMPVVFTRKLQLRRAQRIGLNCLFALGGLVLAASAARVNAVHKLAVEPDLPWWFANAMIWSVLENHLAIVVACAPSVKVIALLAFPRVTSSIRGVVSKVTPSSSRSRSRASGAIDLETGSMSTTRKSDQLKPTPYSTPLPSPALTVDTRKSRASRASGGFAKWFRSPTSPRALESGDSIEGHGLVYAEELRSVHVEHTITVEENRKSHDAAIAGGGTVHAM
ncbi:hypothetical protein BU24DRAFT_424859 [Aaosphaeria arxii CBS 175.79]|uniref:Rhodopsin domain-containing protein n=1 Tax=Aaosphaeria arxii CBS 175.79 TaxID=1450172 RepID=A0A6A5XLP3_9PLEO|nr:uncharacterized protein BU24DRAFT_424859 [Aaosphaeria arxii CBS 175.79]KAF2013826.1 hypothetical protein BU24DRAFT_424859 [Aaosphaeria arxii CBS 175.79]